MKIAVVGLAVALCGALLVIAFLLGQRSVTPAPSPQAARAPIERPTERLSEQDAIALRQPAEPSEPPEPARPDSPPQDVALQRSGRTVTIASTDNNAAVDRYLAQVHALQVGPAGNDSNAFAQQLLSDSMQGDTSGIDDLLRQAKDAERKARALTPPAGAEAHHARLVELMAESTRLLATERTALVQKNPDALGSLLSSAKSLEAKAHALEQAEQALQKR